MTCIAGIASDGVVTIGGDSAGVSGYDLAIRRDPKVFKRGEWVFGFTTSFRMGQLIQHALVLPDGIPSRNLERFMATTFVDAVRSCLATGGYRKRQDEVESGGTFLVGIRGRLFQVQGDFQVAERRMGLDAVGSGADVALGSLFTSTGSPRERVRLALKAAAFFSTAVAPPFRVVEAKP